MYPDSKKSQSAKFGANSATGLSTRRKLALVVVLILLGQLALDFGSDSNTAPAVSTNDSTPDYESLVNQFETSSLDTPEPEVADNQILIPTSPESTTIVQSASFNQSPPRTLELPPVDSPAETPNPKTNPQIRLLGTIEPLE